MLSSLHPNHLRRHIRSSLPKQVVRPQVTNLCAGVSGRWSSMFSHDSGASDLYALAVASARISQALLLLLRFEDALDRVA